MAATSDSTRPSSSSRTDTAGVAWDPGAEADYRDGRWCGQCRYGVVEDPPCCTQPSGTTRGGLSLAPVGALYLDRATGDVYRLRSYRIDWKADPFTGVEDQPDYAVHYCGGMSSMADLPPRAELIWSPDGDRP